MGFFKLAASWLTYLSVGGLACVATTAEAKDYCLSAKAMSVQGITWFSKKSNVLKAFGKPNRTKKGMAEGTGSYKFTNLYYDGLVIRIDETKRKQWVDDLVLTGSKYALPSGIRVGMAKAKVAELLGNPPLEFLSNDSWGVPLCPDYENFEVVAPIFKFDGADKLKKIQFLYNQP